MKFLLFAFILGLSVPVHSKEIISFDVDKVPPKLHKIFQSINPDSEQDKDLVALALEFNNVISLPINPEIFENIIDIEMTKAILTAHSPKKIDISKVLDALKEINAKKRDEVDPFFSEIENGMIKEFNDLYETPFFRDFLRTKRNDLAVQSREVSVIEKKIRLIFPWINYINKTPTPEKKLLSIKIREQILRDLIKSASFLAKYEDKKSKGIGHYISVKLVPNEDEKVLPDGLPLYPTASKHYKAPEKLPEPTDAWRPLGDIFDLDGLPMTKEDLFPAPVENYVPPQVLPEPTDEWILSP